MLFQVGEHNLQLLPIFGHVVCLSAYQGIFTFTNVINLFGHQLRHFSCRTCHQNLFGQEFARIRFLLEDCGGGSSFFAYTAIAVRNIDRFHNAILCQFHKRCYCLILQFYEIRSFAVGHTYGFHFYASQFPVLFRVGGDVGQSQVTISIFAEFSRSIVDFVGFYFKFYLGFGKTVNHSIVFSSGNPCQYFGLCIGGRCH